MSSRDVLAIDFGTANSYFCKCADGQFSPKGVDFGDGRDGLATAILYRQNRPPLVGYTALDEYGEARGREKAGYTLRTHFKPDIAVGEEARSHAVDYLAAVLEEARHQRIDLEPGNRQVIFGVPSEAEAEYRGALCEVALRAGYGDITMVDEPKGALLYHVFHKDIPVRNAQQGLLVVDFGGGTCDFAFLVRGNVRHSWGDMRLGGRLFDDLFFQWFLEQNPASLESIREDGNEYYLHSFLCREIKEYFSRTMARDRTEKISKALAQYGRISGMTWEEFIHRAGAYSPSPTLTGFLAEVGQHFSLIGNRKDYVNLIQWFRDCLRQGLREAGIDNSAIRSVILAGGSSSWPFVCDILREEIGIGLDKIMRSDRPYASIAEGLAIYPSLRKKFLSAKAKLKKELPDFRKSKLDGLLENRAAIVAREISESISRELYDGKIKPVLDEFRSRGGSVESLKSRMSNVATSFESRLKRTIEEKITVFAGALPVAVRELLGLWFEKHGLIPPEVDMVVDVETSLLKDLSPEVPDVIERIFGIAVAAVIAPVGAMICGGGGMALIASGPLGLVIGFVLTAVVAYLSVKYGPVRAKEMAEKWEIPNWILKRAITDGKITRIREKLSREIEMAILRELAGKRDELTDQVEMIVINEIEALSDINKL